MKDKGITLEAYPRFSFQIQVKGNDKIIDRKSFTIVGKEMNTSINMKENFELIQGF